MIFPQLKFDINNEIITDNFAGCGCISTGIEMPPRQHVSVANNHSPKPPQPPTAHSLDAIADHHPDRRKTIAYAPMPHPPQAACYAAHLEVIE